MLLKSLGSVKHTAANALTPYAWWKRVSVPTVPANAKTLQAEAGMYSSGPHPSHGLSVSLRHSAIKVHSPRHTKNSCLSYCEFFPDGVRLTVQYGIHYGYWAFMMQM
jgi:hypothetical protein